MIGSGAMTSMPFIEIPSIWELYEGCKLTTEPGEPSRMNKPRSTKLIPENHLALIIALITLLLSTTSYGPQAEGKPMTQTATGTFVVSMKPLAFEGADAEFKLGRMSIDKQISGDLTASTMGQMLSAMTGTDGSAGYVALERVEGVLDGKRGAFVLQHTGTMNRGVPSLLVTVVPDSGTEELVGLEGEFKINIEEGKHSYEFTYRLPAAAE